MRKATKLLTLVLAALMIMSVVSIPASAAYTDVSLENAALYDAVELLSTLGVAKGTTETTFGPDELVTRQQMAAFIFRLMKAGKSIEGGTNETTFADLDDATFYYMISWANQTGIIKGRSETSFDPKGNITLQDAYTMLVRALEYEKDETLPYPFGYINQAEELGLDENLPSSVVYTDKLTRGDVAIILANAFYADMNKVESGYNWVPKNTGRYEYTDLNGDGDYTDAGEAQAIVEYAYVLEDKVATVASYIFGIETEKFLVTATANNGYNGEQATKQGLADDVDTVVGVRYGESGTVIDYQAERKFSEFGLPGTSDDYFLDEITVFVKKNADKNIDKDEIVAAKSNLVKKTVAAKDVVIDRNTKKEDKYYVGGTAGSAFKKTMTGLIDFAGTKAYVDFTNAPYSYKNLNDGIVGDKNAVEFLSISNVEYDAVGTRFDYVIDDSNTHYDGMADGVGTNYDKLDEEFFTRQQELYEGGFAEAVVYDSNGDGYAEYVVVKPYTTLKIEDESDKVLAYYGNITATAPTAYIDKEDINIVGDYKAAGATLAYVGPVASGDPVYVEIKDSLDIVDSVIYSSATTTIDLDPTVAGADTLYTYTLKSGEVINSTAFYTVGNNYKWYVKGDKIVASYNPTATNFDADLKYGLLIPTDKAVDTGLNAPGNIGTISGNAYVFALTGVADGKVVNNLYVNMLMDGKKVAVKLADTIYAPYKWDTVGSTKDFVSVSDVKAITLEDKKSGSTTYTAQAIAEAIIQNHMDTNFVTYTTGSDNSVVLKPMDYATSGLGNTTTEVAVQFTSTGFSMNNYASTVYELGTGSGSSFAAANKTLAGSAVSKLNMQSYSKFIIHDTDDNVYEVFTADTLPKFKGTAFTNVKGVLVNNTANDMENIGIMYAETTALDYADTKNYQIVTGITTLEDKVLLKLVDVKTGAVTENVEGKENVTFAVGNFVEIKENGKADNAPANTTAPLYSNNAMFKTTFDNGLDTFDAKSGFLNFSDITTEAFLVNADTTYFWYTDANTYEVVNSNILNAELNPYSTDLGDANRGGATAFDIYVVAESHASATINSNVKIVKTIIVAKTGTVLN